MKINYDIYKELTKPNNRDALMQALQELDDQIDTMSPPEPVKPHKQSLMELIAKIEEHLPVPNGEDVYKYFHKLKEEYPDDFSRLRFDDTADGSIFSQNLEFILSMIDYKIPEDTTSDEDTSGYMVFSVKPTKDGKLIPNEDFSRLMNYINETINLKNLQKESKEWTSRNFGTDRHFFEPFLGVVEEVGELSHALLKQKQGIRLNEAHEHNIKDAVGDIIIFLLDFCNLKGYDLTSIIVDTWNEVKKRNWNKDKIKGAV